MLNPDRADGVRLVTDYQVGRTYASAEELAEYEGTSYYTKVWLTPSSYQTARDLAMSYGCTIEELIQQVIAEAAENG